MTALSIVGVPSSAGSYAAGQDQAPRALRAAGLVATLESAGLEIADAGDLTEQVWAPDRANPLAQNESQVVASVRELAAAAAELLAGDGRLLVLGGNCLTALGALDGLAAAGGGPAGLLYLDRHYDMNTPASTGDGAFDWMGIGHALDLPGAADALAGAFGARPLLTPDRLCYLGIEAECSTAFERESLTRLRIPVIGQDDLVTDPPAAAARALAALPDVPLVVHVDVDVLDFVDAPLAENTDGRNRGPTLEQLGAALTIAVTDPRWRALTVGELNPTRAAGEPDLLVRFNRVLAGVLAGALTPAG